MGARYRLRARKERNLKLAGALLLAAVILALL